MKLKGEIAENKWERAPTKKQQQVLVLSIFLLLQSHTDGTNFFFFFFSQFLSSQIWSFSFC